MTETIVALREYLRNPDMELAVYAAQRGLSWTRATSPPQSILNHGVGWWFCARGYRGDGVVALSLDML
jgi:hypothetical protein